MIGYMFVVLMMWILLKLNLLVLRSVGRIAGIVLGSVGYLVLGTVAVTVIGLTMLSLPIILVVGITGLLAESR